MQNSGWAQFSCLRCQEQQRRTKRKHVPSAGRYRERDVDREEDDERDGAEDREGADDRDGVVERDDERLTDGEDDGALRGADDEYDGARDADVDRLDVERGGVYEEEGERRDELLV